jgi:hypothetical protein
MVGRDGVSTRAGPAFGMPPSAPAVSGLQRYSSDKPCRRISSLKTGSRQPLTGEPVLPLDRVWPPWFSGSREKPAGWPWVE